MGPFFKGSNCLWKQWSVLYNVYEVINHRIMSFTVFESICFRWCLLHVSRYIWGCLHSPTNDVWKFELPLWPMFLYNNILLLHLNEIPIQKPSVRITKQKGNTVTTFSPTVHKYPLCTPNSVCGFWEVRPGTNFFWGGVVQKEEKAHGCLVWFLVSLAILSSQNIFKGF